MKDFTMKVIRERREDWIKHIKDSDKSDIKEEPMASIKDSDFFNYGKKRLAFLDLLLQQHLITNTLTLEDLREEVDTFMFAVSI
jgi:hypothetical protein